MSIEVTERAISASQSTGVARLVLLCLCWHADHRGVAWPGRQTIMEWTNAGESAVKNGIKSLVKTGEIEVLKQGGGRARSNLYLVRVGLQATQTGQNKPGLENPVSNKTGQNKPGFQTERGHILPEKGSEYDPEPSKNRHRGGGGGDARDLTTFREDLLSACGADPVSGLVDGNGSMLGKRDQMEVAERWKSDLGLTEPEILSCITDTLARKRDGPPRSLTYFTPAMQRLAADLAEARTKPMTPAPLKAIPGGRHDGTPATSRQCTTKAVDEYIRRRRAGTLNGGPDPSDPCAGG